MADTSRPSSSSKTRTVRSQKIQLPSPTAAQGQASDQDESLDRALPYPKPYARPLILQEPEPRRSAQGLGKFDTAALPVYSSQSILCCTPAVTAHAAGATPPAFKTASTNGDTSASARSSGDIYAGSSTEGGGRDSDSRRPLALRSTSAIASKSAPAKETPPRKPSQAARARSRDGARRPSCPSSGMYWSRAPVSGAAHTPLRAHTTTLVGSNVYVFGGCDSRACFNELYVLDADSFHWSSPHVVGDIPVPLRAMTCTAVGKKLVIFGGGDGPAYYNDVPRRAHTACLYKNGIYVFGGGDGVRALNDIWRLDVSDVTKMSWKLVSSPTSSSPNSTTARDNRPKARGYHTANMVGSKLIIYGGSDGGECFNDVWVYDVDTHTWKAVGIPITFRRLSHTATIVGSYLFVIGGHDGNEYSNDVLLLNLVTMTWDKRRIYGLPPSGRGYHGTILYDSRLVVIGGFDGSEVFSDVWMLELAVHAYYSQISHFTIEV
ncbi:galactose oxidase [Apiospora kogelbergensis]|uniref:galactose oxidase n=1 Tax=Apiospora kogelbergensis TaxID=1337665 RepID=UPI0031319E8A